jgi:hypothetical protein
MKAEAALSEEALEEKAFAQEAGAPDESEESIRIQRTNELQSEGGRDRVQLNAIHVYLSPPIPA